MSSTDDSGVPVRMRLAVTMIRSDGDHLAFVLAARNPGGTPGPKVAKTCTRKK